LAPLTDRFLLSGSAVIPLRIFRQPDGGCQSEIHCVGFRFFLSNE
jgi:hypothetical protein